MGVWRHATRGLGRLVRPGRAEQDVRDEVAHYIEQVSRGVFKVNPGSLLTALQRLERRGWLDSEWRETENSRRAKYYALTRTGRKQLDVETADWSRRAMAISRLLSSEA